MYDKLRMNYFRGCLDLHFETNRQFLMFGRTDSASDTLFGVEIISFV